MSHPGLTRSSILFYFYQLYIFHLQFTDFDVCQRWGEEMDMVLKSNMSHLHHQVPSIMTLGTLLVLLSMESTYIISVCVPTKSWFMLQSFKTHSQHTLCEMWSPYSCYYEDNCHETPCGRNLSEFWKIMLSLINWKWNNGKFPPYFTALKMISTNTGCISC